MEHCIKIIDGSHRLKEHLSKVHHIGVTDSAGIEAMKGDGMIAESSYKRALSPSLCFNSCICINNRE